MQLQIIKSAHYSLYVGNKIAKEGEGGYLGCLKSNMAFNEFNLYNKCNANKYGEQTRKQYAAMIYHHGSSSENKTEEIEIILPITKNYEINSWAPTKVLINIII